MNLIPQLSKLLTKLPKIDQCGSTLTFLFPCKLSVTSVRIVKAVHTEGRQDSSCERVLFAYQVL